MRNVASLRHKWVRRTHDGALRNNEVPHARSSRPALRARPSLQLATCNLQHVSQRVRCDCAGPRPSDRGAATRSVRRRGRREMSARSKQRLLGAPARASSQHRGARCITDLTSVRASIGKRVRGMSGGGGAAAPNRRRGDRRPEQRSLSGEAFRSGSRKVDCRRPLGNWKSTRWSIQARSAVGIRLNIRILVTYALCQEFARLFRPTESRTR